MTTIIQDIAPTDDGASSLTKIEANFASLNTNKVETATHTSDLATKFDKAWWIITWLIQQAESTDIVSAWTTNLATATWNKVHITWNTTITSFWTVTAGTQIELTFMWTPILTHNATSMILPGSANIPASVWDNAMFMSEWAWNWRCMSYQKANWQPVSGGLPTTTTQSTYITAWNALFILPADWKVYKTVASDLTKIDFVWFATNTGTTWQNITIDTSWVNANQSWLTIGADYSLSNTAWAIATVPWTYAISIWKATSTISILIDVWKSAIKAVITTMNSTIGTTWTVYSTTFQADANYFASFTVGQVTSNAGLGTSWTLQYSLDNTNWYNVCTVSQNFIATSVQSMCGFLIKGVYYRTVAYSANNTATSITNTLVSLIKMS